MHRRLDAATVVVSPPSSPQGAAEMRGCPHNLIARKRTGGESPLRLRVLAGRSDSGGASIGNGIVALACVMRAAGSDTANLDI